MTVTEPSLFDWQEQALPARGSDPATSRKAALELPRNQRQCEVLRALRHRGVSSTADEVKQTLAEWNMSRERNEVASRLSELADEERFDAPLVRRFGLRKNHKNKSVMTWHLTAAGLTTAKALDQ